MINDIPLTPEDVEEIVSILTKSDYETLELETTRFRLRVARAGEGWSQEWSAIDSTAPETEATAVTKITEEPEDNGSLLLIRSPLPGTFYRAPQPGADPFVSVGDRVTPNTEVAIVETMKLMTTISAGVSGEVVDIVYEDATPIEAQAILIRVKPDDQA